MVSIASLRAPATSLTHVQRSGKLGRWQSFRPLSSRSPTIGRRVGELGCNSTASCAVLASSAGDTSQAGLSTAIRNIGWISFWSQFTLSIVSGVVLLFSTGMMAGGAFQPSPTDVLTATGVVTGLIAAFISWGLVRTGRLISEGKQVKLEFVMAAVLTSTRLNLIGLGATILGMQASIGGLVAKTLSSAAGGMAYYNARVAPPPVAYVL